MSVDFSTIFQSTSGAEVATAIIACAQLLAAVYFVKYVARAVGRFFDDDDGDSEGEYSYYQACRKCGTRIDEEEQLCMSCWERVGL